MFTVAQISAVLALLVAFNVPQSEIDSVRVILESNQTPMVKSVVNTVEAKSFGATVVEPSATFDAKVSKGDDIDGNAEQPGFNADISISGEFDTAYLHVWDAQQHLKVGTGYHEKDGESGQTYTMNTIPPGTYTYEIGAKLGQIEKKFTGSFEVK